MKNIIMNSNYGFDWPKECLFKKFTQADKKEIITVPFELGINW